MDNINIIIKVAAFLNCFSYQIRLTPFFDTADEVEVWATANGINIDDAATRQVRNWQQTIDVRSELTTDSRIPAGR